MSAAIPPYIPRFDRHLRLSSQTLASVVLNTSVCRLEHKCLSAHFLIYDNQCVRKLREAGLRINSANGCTNLCTFGT